MKNKEKKKILGKEVLDFLKIELLTINEMIINNSELYSDVTLQKYFLKKQNAIEETILYFEYYYN